MKNFNKKVVVITGAASGMGRAYALAFAKLGSYLALCDFDQTALEETSRLVKEVSEATPFLSVFDISDREATFQFASDVKQHFGNAHVIINNAGIEGSAKPSWKTDEQSFKRVMDVNYFGVVNGTLAFLPQMKERNEGVIVNVSSIFGLAGMPNHADYCGSKFAVRGFTESLMVELINTSIQVHLLHPGGIATNIVRHDHGKEFAEKFFKTTPEQIAHHLIESIQKKKLRIVYGHGSTKTWLGVRLLPLRVLIKLIWAELSKVIDLGDYNQTRNQKVLHSE